MRAPIIPTVEAKGEPENSRSARKFNDAERADPFARTVAQGQDSLTPANEMDNGNAGDKLRTSQLLDKFDLTRVDLLHHMNEAVAEQYK